MGAARGTEHGPRTGSHTHVNQRKNTTEPGSGAGRAMDETRPRKPQAMETGWTDWIRLQPTETKWMTGFGRTQEHQPNEGGCEEEDKRMLPAATGE